MTPPDETTMYRDEVFAPVDLDHALERIAGGNETEVYRTDDQRYVIKLKHDPRYSPVKTLPDALRQIAIMRAGAEEFAHCLGSEYSIPVDFVISRDSAGQLQILVVQPFIANAQPLYSLNYATLSDKERARIAKQLRDIIRRALTMYRARGCMPDLYGRTSASKAARIAHNAPHMLPWRLWGFLVKRTLLRSNNLLVSNDAERRIVLIDYDIVMRSKLYRQIYYAIRWLLFWRDHLLIAFMRRGAPVPS